MRKLLVICHPKDRFITGSYVLHAVLLTMRRAGLSIKVQRHWDEWPPADAVIPHVDLTVWPESFVAGLDRYANVVNRRLIDLRKRSVSAHLLRRGDDWRGPVIVKTDLNYGGMIDRRNVDAAAGADDPSGRSAPMSNWARRCRDGKYRVFDTLAAVPNVVWKDPDLVVERYHAERKGRLYGLRQLFIAGDAIIMRRLWAPVPIVKADTVTEREWLDEPPPPDVLTVARERGVEFGKIEYTVVDGRAFVFDVARTPTGGTWIRSSPDLITRLARGLLPLLERSSDPRPMEIAS